METFEPPLDIGIAQAVCVLREIGINTFDSCEGGHGHAFPVPTVRFHGDKAEGFRALGAALKSGLLVEELRRVWCVHETEPVGPVWEMTFAVRDN